jgi:hypothetical protein
MMITITNEAGIESEIQTTEDVYAYLIWWIMPVSKNCSGAFIRQTKYNTLKNIMSFQAR